MEKVIFTEETETEKKWTVKVGQTTKDFISSLKLNDKERKSALKEAMLLMSEFGSPNNEQNDSTGIAIGYVQSGKTLSFTILTSLAADNGYRVVIILAGITNLLVEQTTNRLNEDLKISSLNRRKFKLFTNPTKNNNDDDSIKNAFKLLDKPMLILCVRKAPDRINNLCEIFETPDVKNALGNQATLIIDDEADQASLNRYARRNSNKPDWDPDKEFSPTYLSIQRLKGSLVNHTYIQYTATPQAPLFINIMDLLSPKFHEILTPGENYTGGKLFFIEKKGLIKTISKKEVYHHKTNDLPEPPDSLINAMQIYFMGAALQIHHFKSVNQLSMMIHADSIRDASRKFYKWAFDLKNSWLSCFDLEAGDPARSEIYAEFKNNYKETIKFVTKPPSFERILPFVIDIIRDTNIELVIEDKKYINWNSNCSHIIIGADKLNRGFTVEGLMVTYMPRHSLGVPNADTIQQRCRFFGYKKKYISTCRVYLPQDSIDEYTEYVEHEENMRKLLKSKTLKEFERLLILKDNMQPTRSNVLSGNIVRYKLNGWRQFNLLSHINFNARYIEDFLRNIKFNKEYDYKTPDRRHKYVDLDIELVIGFLDSIKMTLISDIFRKSATLQYLSYWKIRGVKKCRLVLMAYLASEGRSRKLVYKKGEYVIQQIFSGPDKKNPKIYPGDKEIMAEDLVTIQIHKVRPKLLGHELNDNLLYTLGIYYPENYVKNFIALENK